MKFTLGKTTVEIKFDYRTMFKVERELSTKDDHGNSNNDGVGVLFGGILNMDDNMLVRLIKLCVSNKAKDPTTDEVLVAIEKYMENSEAEDPYEALFKEVEEAMVESGFFSKKILRYIETTEKVTGYLKSLPDSEPLQIQLLEELTGKMKAAISSETVQD